MRIRSHVRRHPINVALALAVFIGGCEPDLGPVPVGSVKISLATEVLVRGDSLPLNAIALSVGGDTLPNGEFEWTSSDPAVAVIGFRGARVLAREVGEAWLIAELSGRTDSVLVQVAPDELPLLDRPFAGYPLLMNPFDHRLPHAMKDTLPGVIDWRGESLSTLNGHAGYDWLLEPGTPILASADGLVRFAGMEEPWSCPLLGGDTVAALVVRVRHTASTGEVFHSVYIHLERLDVTEGELVSTGDMLGLSGNTGCSTRPHLHFEVMRERYWRQPIPGYVRVTDPSGWGGAGLDPWLGYFDGVASTRLWVEGREPSLIPGGIGMFTFETRTSHPVDIRRPDDGIHRN